MEKAEISTGGVEVIDAISTEWEKLCEEGASNEPFLRPEWFRAFVQNFGLIIDLLTVRSDGRLRAVLPMTRIKGTLHGVPVRKLSAVYNLNTPRFDLIHGSEESERSRIITAIWRKLQAQQSWDLLEFRLVDRASWLGDLLARAERENYMNGAWQMDGAPFITLPAVADVKEFDQKYFKAPGRKHLGADLNRRVRRLKELGEVEIKVTRKFSPEIIERYLGLEQKGWKGRNGTDAGNDQNVAKLHNDFSRATADKDAFIVYELKLDEKTIAMFINMRYGDRTMYWKTSYDEDYRKYSPGNILFREFLHGCIHDGSTEIDLLSPSTDNKKFWATGEREHCAFYVFRPGILGAFLWMWKFGIVARLREMRHRNSKTLTPVRA